MNSEITTYVVNDEVIVELLEIVGDGIQWKEDLISLTGLIMRILQQKRELKGKGASKKKLVEVVFQELIERNFFNQRQADLVKNFLAFLPTTIDMLKGLARAISDAKFTTCCW